MQNGSLGEARAKAFLLDRFWVLERSVDIDGADFIIQRRLTTKTLLDREVPRLGVVQVKFFGSSETTHYVHKEYVLDAENRSRGEFFLLCHAGSEEAQQAFLVTAEELYLNFTLSETAGGSRFYVPFRQLQRYEVKNRKLALDRIENHLRLADFTKNRYFVSWILPSPETELDAILPDYKEPIQNYWGNIPKEFAELKRKARRALFDVEEAYNLLLKVADATDPLDAEKAIAELSYICRHGNGRWNIDLPDDLDDQELFDVCKEHRAKVAELKREGLLDAFLELYKAIQDHVVSVLTPSFPVDRNIVQTVLISYDPLNFLVKQITSKVTAIDELGLKPETDANEKAWPHRDWLIDGRTEELKPGELQIIWAPGRWGFSADKPDRNLAAFQTFPFPIYRESVEVAYARRFPTDKPK